MPIKSYITGSEAGNIAQVDRDGSLGVNLIGLEYVKLTNIASSTSSVQLLDHNGHRRFVIIFNDSNQSLYIKYGNEVSLTSFTYKLIAGATLEMALPCYLGRITGIWNSVNGTARITEGNHDEA